MRRSSINSLRKRRPERLLGDTAYDNGSVRAELAGREVEVLAPVPEGQRREGRVDKREFEDQPRRGDGQRPAGELALIRTEPSGQRRASLRRQPAIAAR